MKPSIRFSKRRLAPALALLAAALFAPCVAQATPLVINIVQQGSDVVATGSGAFDLTGLTFAVTQSLPYAGGIVPSGTNGIGLVINGPGANVGQVDVYESGTITGPTWFGTGTTETDTFAGSSGDAFGFAYVPSYPIMELVVPHNYASNANLSGSATWANATFASLGLTPGTYQWTYGANPDQLITLDISTVSVPEPAALGMFGLGLLLLGGFVTLRRRGSLAA